MKKFNIVLGNPPYQTHTDGNSRATWPAFVQKAFELATPDGYVALIHPSGWRNVKGKYSPIKDLLLSKDMLYLEMHDKQDGQKTFGASTTYDWYVVKNCNNTGILTTVTQRDGTIIQTNLNKLPMIPSGHFNELQTYKANPVEETAETLHDYTAYETRKAHMLHMPAPDGKVVKTKTAKHKYPAVYLVCADGTPTLLYSSTKNGHFGIPKLIWGNGGYTMGSFLDLKGEYGLTPYAYAIVDTPKNLPLIKKAFDSEKFRNMMKSFDGGQDNINHKIIATFRKDFWKDFV